ncbi:hypothetical protein ACRAR1_00570 [Streptomyces sanyensis]|uniref:hypothetical protein n=1 Tax=Streptomyces sanyensis TaxID=568869 RepID=UPI003D7713F1
MATRAGAVCVAYVVDAFSRRIVGWSAATSKETQLALDVWRWHCGSATAKSILTFGAS